MKNFLLALTLLIVSVLQAQVVPHMGLAVQLLTDHQKDFSLYAKDYPGMTSFQFSLVYDPAKMSYLGANNSNLLAFDESNFGNPVAGSLVCSWFDIGLEGQNVTDSTVLIQLFFLVLVPGGSSLCFTDTPLDLEFSQITNNNDIDLTEINLHDACYSGLVLLTTSGIEIPEKENTQKINKVALSQNGELRFSVLKDEDLSFRLIETTGKIVGSIYTQSYLAGENNAAFSSPLVPALYYLLVTNDDHLMYSIPVSVQ